MWGGLANYMGKVKDGIIHRLSILEFVGDLFIAGFIGVITFWLCEWSDIAPLLSAAMIGVSGHMGSRAIFHLEAFLKAKFPGEIKP